MENAKKFFEEVLKTEEAKAAFAEIEKPETEKERIEAYIEIAKKLGVELTAEEIAAYFSSEAPSGEIDDEELSQLVGGGDTCSSTYTSGENCWFNDGCDLLVKYYDNYDCGSQAKEKAGNIVDTVDKANDYISK